MMFDVLIVGETPTAMAAAALLVRKDLDVAWVVPSGSSFVEGGKGGGPKIPDVIWDLLPQVLVREILERLGVPYRHLEKGEHQGGGIQMVTPEFRTGSLDGIHEIRSELRRIFGLVDAELDKVFPPLPPGSAEEFIRKYGGGVFKGPGGKKANPLSLVSGESIVPFPFQVEGLRVEPALRRFFELGVYSQTYLCQWAFPRSLVRHFLHNLGHLNIFAQGRLVSPEEIFREVFQMGRGEIFQAREEITLEPHREKGISFWANPDEVINGSVCLLSVSPADAPEFFERLPVSSKRLRAKGDTDDIPCRVADIRFSLDVDGLPGGMGENLILYTGDATEPFDPKDLAYMTLEKAEGSEVLEGVYTVFHEEAPEEPDLQAWASRHISRLEGLFPFMTRHLAIEEVRVGQRHPLSPCSFYHYGTRKRRLGAPRIKEGILGRNIYFMDRRQLDYLGLEGEIITALKAVRWALDRLTKI